MTYEDAQQKLKDNMHEGVARNVAQEILAKAESLGWCGPTNIEFRPNGGVRVQWARIMTSKEAWTWAHDHVEVRVRNDGRIRLIVDELEKSAKGFEILYSTGWEPSAATADMDESLYFAL